MDILSDKFPCWNGMFAHEQLPTGETVEYTGARHCQRLSILMWNNSFKTPLTNLAAHPLPQLTSNSKFFPHSISLLRRV